jgi:hypothetical protein
LPGIADRAAAPALRCPAEQKRQSPAEEPGFFIRRLRRRYFAPATLPNWLSNGL